MYAADRQLTSKNIFFIYSFYGTHWIMWLIKIFYRNSFGWEENYMFKKSFLYSIRRAGFWFDSFEFSFLPLQFFYGIYFLPLLCVCVIDLVAETHWNRFLYLKMSKIQAGGHQRSNTRSASSRKDTISDEILQILMSRLHYWVQYPACNVSSSVNVVT